jgi:cellulose synthase/poly-beta-1,6-N-acetylglucosamine synthase-like glycosyltransferase
VGGPLAAAGLALLLLLLELRVGRAPRLRPAEGALPGGPELFLRVVIPAYNEAFNIGDCVRAVLASDEPGVPWQLLVSDDGSSDSTAALAREAMGSDARASLLEAGPRPTGERWVGKNWAASIAAAHPWPAGSPEGQWLLFIDADVRLKPPALAAALEEARRENTDLLSLAPRLQCGCLAEWLVQPIVSALLGLVFPLQRTNDPADPTAFAAGPFMLFRRDAYEAVGGHAAIADVVVEDLTLARRIKGSGRRLRYLVGADLLDLRMYRNLAALWEGWTKNWFLGLDRSLVRAFGSAALVLLLFAGPWALALAGILASAIRGVPLWSLLLPASAGIGLVLALALWRWWRFGLRPRYWWLSWLGALLIAAIVPASIWKTSTGRGWTWRGRSLA